MKILCAQLFIILMTSQTITRDDPCHTIQLKVDCQLPRNQKFSLMYYLYDNRRVSAILCEAEAGEFHVFICDRVTKKCYTAAIASDSKISVSKVQDFNESISPECGFQFMFDIISDKTLSLKEKKDQFTKLAAAINENSSSFVLTGLAVTKATHEQLKIHNIEILELLPKIQNTEISRTVLSNK